MGAKPMDFGARRFQSLTVRLGTHPLAMVDVLKKHNARDEYLSVGGK